MKTSCERCAAMTKSGHRCKNMTCKYSPLCYVHKHVVVGDSQIPNSGQGVYAKSNLKKGTMVGRYTIGTDKMTLQQMNAKFPDVKDRTHIWSNNRNAYFDAEKTNSIAGKYNSCTPRDARKMGCKNNARINNVGNIVLNRNVKQDREIYVSYGREYWRNRK